MCMTFKILTSKFRLFDLPLKSESVEEDEKIVATSAPQGRLFVHNKTLYDFSQLEENQLPSKGSAIALPSIDDYIDSAKISLVNRMKMLKDLETICRGTDEKETDREVDTGNGREG